VIVKRTSPPGEEKKRAFSKDFFGRDSRNRGELGLGRSPLGHPKAASAAGLVLFVQEGSQELLFLAPLASKGDQILYIALQVLDNLLRIRGLEAGNRGVPMSSCPGCLLGSLHNVLHGVAHLTQDLLSMGRDKLELILGPAVLGTDTLKDIQVKRVLADGLPANGERTALGSTRVDSWLEGVFLNGNARKANAFRGAGLCSCGISFGFQTIHLLHNVAFAHVSIKSVESILGKAFDFSSLVDSVGRYQFLGENLVGGASLKIGRRGAHAATSLFGREDIDRFGSGMVELLYHDRWRRVGVIELDMVG